MQWKKSFTCPSCGYNEIVVFLDEHIIDSILSEEREMGPELQHTIHYEVKCPRIGCRSDLVISGDIFEYSVGCINRDETAISFLE